MLSITSFSLGTAPQDQDLTTMSFLVALTKRSKVLKTWIQNPLQVQGAPELQLFNVRKHTSGSNVRSPCPCAPPQVPRSKTFTPSLLPPLLQPCKDLEISFICYKISQVLKWKALFMLHCFSLQDFMKCIIPSHVLFNAKKFMCHSEIYLTGIHSTWLGSSTYIIYWEALQLLSYSFTIGADATGMMSVKCWVGLSLSSWLQHQLFFKKRSGGGNLPHLS